MKLLQKNGGSSGNKQMKLAIGTITYGDSTAKYLPDFFASLSQQTFKDFKLIVVDNSETEENANKKFIQSVAGLDLDFSWNGENIGFARAYNKIIKKADSFRVEYFLVINPDVKLATDTLEKMIQVLDADKSSGSVSPKILKWKFDSSTAQKFSKPDVNVIDSCGIRLMPGLRFVDIGQAQEDTGQFDNIEILGPSGACGMYRMSALEKVVEDGRYFDELMFMYKEDCDLAYRLHLAGFKSRCISEAIAHHDRTVAGKGESVFKILKARWAKNRREIKWSFMHQQLIYWKYWRVQNWRDKLVIIYHQFRLLIYIALFEQFLFLSLVEMRNKCRQAKVYGRARNDYAELFQQPKH